ncbi:hypothetical protein Ocin01_08888 [Orchesella cincta]|uniref:Secreted protein n=1 Tax=Orchesella cincta TaxID=48709 RepID=A0A1D2MYB3_ORCCI|nr:hypothetical protein Ocin01_08888 [Orchesella cincta]
MKSFIVVPVLCLVLAGVHSVYSAKNAQAMTIAQATTFCEQAVPAHCIATTCPQYCNSMRTNKQKTRCNGECTTAKRCKLLPAAGNDDPRNQALDAQNRDQLWACIAEKRDPDNKKTGRRETPWQQLQTPSFVRAIRP